MPKIKIVCTDLDDTFVPTEEACFNLENEALSRMGRSPMDREVHIATWGHPLFEAIIERSPGVDVEVFRKEFEVAIAEFIEDGRLDTIPQGSYLAMEKITDSGREFSILTSRTMGEVKHLLEESHRLGRDVTSFWHKGNTKVHKPDPKVFDEFFAHHLNIKPEECVYVGDSLGDAIAAKRAGMLFVASLESGLRAKEDFEKLKEIEGVEVDGYIGKFAELPELIEVLES